MLKESRNIIIRLIETCYVCWHHLHKKFKNYLTRPTIIVHKEDLWRNKSMEKPSATISSSSMVPSSHEKQPNSYSLSMNTQCSLLSKKGSIWQVRHILHQFLAWCGHHTTPPPKKALENWSTLLVNHRGLRKSLWRRACDILYPLSAYEELW